MDVKYDVLMVAVIFGEIVFEKTEELQHIVIHEILHVILEHLVIKF